MMMEWGWYEDGYWIGTHYSDFSAKVANEWEMKASPTFSRGNLSKIFDQPFYHHTTLQISAFLQFIIIVATDMIQKTLF